MMTQGELESIPIPFEQAMSDLEMRVMSEIVRAIRTNGFSTSTADSQIHRLVQMGKSEKEIRKQIQELLNVTDKEIDKIFSDTVYEQYYGYNRAYRSKGVKQISFDKNQELQSLIAAVKLQTSNAFRNMTNSLGFAIRNPATGKISYSPLMQFYQDTLTGAVMDISSGAINYDKVISRAIQAMTTSGLRWIDYDSGWHNRVNVAARRAVMTGFRQIQGKINEQAAEELETDSYEVSYHIGARPEHQVWQGRVYTYEQLQSICGLGTVTGLHGANCYHDYNAFIPGVSVRTYTDEQLDQMTAEENTPKEYNGKAYTAYEALQEQRRQETAMRKTRQDIKLLQEGGASKDRITVMKAKYQGQMQKYKAFSGAMKLPEQIQRVYRDGLGRITANRKENYRRISMMKISIPEEVYKRSRLSKSIKEEINNAIKRISSEYVVYLDRIEGIHMNSRDVFITGGFVDTDGLLKHSLVLNYDMDYNGLKDRMQYMYKNNIFAGKSYEDYIAHEMAHIIPFQNCVTEKDYRELSEEIRKSFVEGISGYADKKKDGLESLAEAFVRYRNGEEIPKKAMRLIEEYIEPWRRK